MRDNWQLSPDIGYFEAIKERFTHARYALLLFEITTLLKLCSVNWRIEFPTWSQLKEYQLHIEKKLKNLTGLFFSPNIEQESILQVL